MQQRSAEPFKQPLQRGVLVILHPREAISAYPCAIRLILHGLQLAGHIWEVCLLMAGCDLNLGFTKLSFSFSSHSCCCSQLLSAQGTLAICLTHSQQCSGLTPGSTLRDPSCWSSGIIKWCQEGTHSSCVQDRVLPAVLSFSELRQLFYSKNGDRDPFPHRSSLLEDSAVSSCVPGRWEVECRWGTWRHQGPALMCIGLCKPSLRTSEWDGASHRLHTHSMMDKWGAGVRLVQVLPSEGCLAGVQEGEG